MGNPLAVSISPFNNTSSSSVISLCTNLFGLAQIVSTHVRNGQYDRAHNEEPLTGWRALPELPSSNELMAMEQPILLENDVTIPPSSKITYLETQYRLYRCEAIKPLRRAISIYKRDASMMEDEEVSIYTQVSIPWTLTG